MAFRAFVAGLILFLSLFPPADAVVPELGQPRWAELSLEQKQILSPLSHEWDRMEAYRKKKWLDIAKRYPGMKPEEQARVQSQMKDWASLTPDQRMHARKQYKTLQKAPPQTKKALKQKWQQYKELPDEEKKRLAEKARRKPSSTQGLAGQQRTARKFPATPPQPLPAANPIPVPAPAVAPATEPAAAPQAGSNPVAEEPVPAAPAASPDAPTSSAQQ